MSSSHLLQFFSRQRAQRSHLCLLHWPRGPGTSGLSWRRGDFSHTNIHSCHEPTLWKQTDLELFGWFGLIIISCSVMWRLYWQYLIWQFYSTGICTFRTGSYFLTNYFFFWQNIKIVTGNITWHFLFSLQKSEYHIHISFRARGHVEY